LRRHPQGLKRGVRWVETHRVFLGVESLSFRAGGNCSGTSPGNLFARGNKFHTAELRKLDCGVANGNPFAHRDKLEHVAAFLALETMEESLARRDDERTIITGFAEVTFASPRIAMLFEAQPQMPDDVIDGRG